jgi:hypothetical protein
MILTTAAADALTTAAADALAPQMLHIAALRSEIRSLRSAIDAQQPLMQEASALRAELQDLGSRMEARRRAGQRVRVRQEERHALAESVASAARVATAEMRVQQRHTTAVVPSLQRGSSVDTGDREALLHAARERMRRRGVRDVGTVGGRAADSMMDRLRHVREAEQRVAAAAAAAVHGEPKVRESTLDCTLDDCCSICLEPRRTGDTVWVLECGHTFHKHCARCWLAGAATCPLCKQPVERAPAGRG